MRGVGQVAVAVRPVVAAVPALQRIGCPGATRPADRDLGVRGEEVSNRLIVMAENGRTPVLRITRGLPGCGKTTFARAWVADSPLTRSRSNRDDLGALMHGGRFHGDPGLFRVTEEAITRVQHAQISTLLALGRDVICDDTNLRADVVGRLRAIARRAGADVEMVDMRDVPLRTVLARNARRAGTPALVPEQVIRDLHQRFVANRVS